MQIVETLYKTNPAMDHCGYGPQPRIYRLFHELMKGRLSSDHNLYHIANDTLIIDKIVTSVR